MATAGAGRAVPMGADHVPASMRTRTPPSVSSARSVPPGGAHGSTRTSGGPVASLPAGAAVTDRGGSASPTGNSGPHVPLVTRSLEVHATRPDQLCLLDRLPEFRRNLRLCDVSLRSKEGVCFPAHRLVLALASEALAGLVDGAFAEGQRGLRTHAASAMDTATGHSSSSTSEKGTEIDLDLSSAALEAVLEFVYSGSTRVPMASVCELLRFAHMYALDGLLARLEEAVMERMSASACAELLPESKLLGLESLEAACYQFALQHFEECMQSPAFAGWSAPLLLSLVQSSELVVSSEEMVLRAIFRWHQSGQDRGRETALLLSGVRIPLLAEPTKAALIVRAQSLGLLGVELQSLLRRNRRSVTNFPIDPGGSASGVAPPVGALGSVGPAPAHGGSSTGGEPMPFRRCFKYHWADFGCSIQGGVVVAGGGGQNEAQQIWGPFSLALVGGSVYSSICTERALLIADKYTGRVVSWPLLEDGSAPAREGTAVAGRGAPVTGVNDLGLFFKIGLDESGGLLVASCGEADGSSRVLRFNGTAGELVEVPSLEDTVRDVSAGPNGSMYVLDNDGTRVLRVSEIGSGSIPTVAVVAGSNGRGAGANQLSDAEYMVVAEDGAVYVSDKANHRVQRWDPGAIEGVTVAGGRGAGAGFHQLNEPWGLFVTTDRKVYVADMRNDRIMRWDPGQTRGVVVAGGNGAGAEPHQLSRPTDVVLDESGALYVADWGNHRVVRWGPPPDPSSIFD